MAAITYTLTLTSDNTIRVMVGQPPNRMKEYVGLAGKTKGELFESVKWALIAKDAFVSNEVLMEDLEELLATY